MSYPTIELPETLQNLNPVIITSPIVRSGTTLLQRLICSAENGLIYGESCANELQVYLHLYSSKMMINHYREQEQDEMLEAVLQGNTGEWIADLMPPSKLFNEQLENSCFGMMKFFRSYAESQGRPVWGAKMAGWNPAVLHSFLSMIPNCKIIYITRDPGECLRSAKAVNMVYDMEGAQYLLQQWQTGMQFLASKSQETRILPVSYEELMANPEAEIAKIADFTGAKGIDHSVMGVKLNTMLRDDRQGEVGKGYIHPSTLTDEEKQLVDSVVQRVNPVS